MERAYYIVGEGPILDAATEAREKVESQKKELFALLKQTSVETGCNPATCLFQDGKCIGLVFDRGDPPEYLCAWKKVGKGAWWPKVTTPKGREIVKRFKLKSPAKMEDAIPNTSAFQYLCEKGSMYVPAIMFVELEGASEYEDRLHLILSTPYDEMWSDGPALTDEEILQFRRIKPREFRELMDSHNKRVENFRRRAVGL